MTSPISPSSAAAASQGQSAALGLSAGRHEATTSATTPFSTGVRRVPRRQANHLPASRSVAVVVKHAGMYVREDPLLYRSHHLATRPGWEGGASCPIDRGSGDDAFAAPARGNIESHRSLFTLAAFHSRGASSSRCQAASPPVPRPPASPVTLGRTLSTTGLFYREAKIARHEPSSQSLHLYIPGTRLPEQVSSFSAQPMGGDHQGGQPCGHLVCASLPMREP